MTNKFRSIAVLNFLLLLLVSSGCISNASITKLVKQGRYGQLRVQLARHLESNLSNRNYMLNRMSLVLADLADGQPASAEPTVKETYELLRTHGKNEDFTVVSQALLTEGTKFWKGEPFEQALMFHYIAIQKAQLGQWDNARAAAKSSLFRLQDFGLNDEGDRKSTEDIARAAYAIDKSGFSYFTDNYNSVESNFALGYLLAGIASSTMGREDEANEFYDTALRHNYELSNVTNQLRSGEYNTILVVDYGFGPRKVGYGPDRCLSRFVGSWDSNSKELSVTINGSSTNYFAMACDVNKLAEDHQWNNMDDVRLAKSHIGTVIVAAGAEVARRAAYRRNRRTASAQAVIGIGMMIGGAITKAAAAADLRHCPILPQRIYIAPIMIYGDGSVVSIQLGDEDLSQLNLTGISPPARWKNVQLIYTRLTPNRKREELFAWEVSSEQFYGNDNSSTQVAGDSLPYILGGRCVRLPSAETLSRYQQAGNLINFSVNDLKQLYIDEDIKLAVEEQGGMAGLHILEGGDSLVSPLPGSPGYLRLFGQDHGRYSPRSKSVRELKAKLEIKQSTILSQTS